MGLAIFSGQWALYEKGGAQDCAGMEAQSAANDAALFRFAPAKR